MMCTCNSARRVFGVSVSLNTEHPDIGVLEIILKYSMRVRLYLETYTV